MIRSWQITERLEIYYCRFVYEYLYSTSANILRFLLMYIIFTKKIYILNSSNVYFIAFQLLIIIKKI